MGLVGRIRAALTEPARPRRPMPTGTPVPAPIVSGVDSAGQPAVVEVGCGRHTLLFLTSSCAPCRELWAAPGPDAIIVTPSPSTESRRAVAALSPETTPVVMSSETWNAYGVTKAPWRIVLEAGAVVEDGPAAAG